MSPALCSSTNTLSTAFDSPSSIVKRSRLQSQEAPSRFSWLTMVPPDCAFHSHTRFTNFVASEALVVDLLLGQLPRDDELRGDARVIGAGLPEHVLSAHALEAAEHVLQRVVERMPHVQRARHVRRRDDDAVGLGFRAPVRGKIGAAGLECPDALPSLVNAGLDLGGIVFGLLHGSAGG